VFRRGFGGKQLCKGTDLHDCRGPAAGPVTKGAVPVERCCAAVRCAFVERVDSAAAVVVNMASEAVCWQRSEGAVVAAQVALAAIQQGVHTGKR